MADFPSLEPQARSYTPGSYAVLRTETLSGKQVSVRRNNAAINHVLRFTFVSGTVDTQNKIFSHYAVHHRFLPFDLPASVLADSDLTFPSGYQWIYARPPQASYEPSKITISVDLQIVAPYAI